MMNHLSQIRRLTTFLIISGALNISLLAIFFYWLVKDTTPTPYFELKPANKREQEVPIAVEHSNSDVIRYLRKMPKEQLIARLNSSQLVENGYTLRDLALASLIDFQHFDIERALLGFAPPQQRRSIVYGTKRDGRPAELIVYPGLSDKQYEAIISFATTERWPLTSKGMFLTLRKQGGVSHEPSLFDAFFLTPEFLTIETLFARSKAPVTKKDLLAVLLQGDWSMLSTFVDQQRVSQDLSSARRQRILLDYVQRKSKAAAQLILKTDENVAAHKLDDNHVIQILKLLDEKTPEAEQFALSLLSSPRSDAVWKMAAARLYAYAGEPMPEKYHHHAALSRFSPKSSLISILAEEPVPVSANPSAMAGKKPAQASSSATQSKTSPANSKFVQVNAPAKAVPVKSSNDSRWAVNNILPPGMQSQSQTKLPVKRERLYIVQEGDSLWKIARRFNVDVEVIKSNNKLQSDFLKPGRPLIIP